MFGISWQRDHKSVGLYHGIKIRKEKPAFLLELAPQLPSAASTAIMATFLHLS
jgi:hypothetical protein